MSKGRLEAFSDGVIAIIITIMVLELKVPARRHAGALLPLLPVFLSYVLSFVYVGIYWNNHHHMLHATTGSTARMLWANLHLLFWLSLFPFATGWMGENHFAAVPDRGLWRRAADGGDRVLHSAAGMISRGRAAVRLLGRRSVGLEGQAFAGALPARHRGGAPGGRGPAQCICVDSAAVADSGSAHRGCDPRRSR